MLTLNIAVFILMQIGATLLFKWGSGDAKLFWWGFGLGNLIGASSIFFLMNVYRILNPNLTAAICTGGSFLAIQLMLFFIYRDATGIPTFIGTLLITSGIVVMSLWK